MEVPVESFDQTKLVFATFVILKTVGALAHISLRPVIIGLIGRGFTIMVWLDEAVQPFSVALNV